MATLIQSKQIQGVITASVIQGDFTVGGGGSVNLSEASGVSGSFSGSYQGDGSGLVGISYSNLTNLPTLFSGSSQVDITQTNGFTAFSSSIATSLSTVDTDTDSQTVSFNTVSKILTISGGNTADLSSLSGGGGGGGDVTHLNTFTESIEIRINAITAATSSYLTSETDSQTLSIVGDQLTISSGNVVTIPTGSGAGVSNYTELTNIPSGIISSSVQILGGTGILSGSHSDLTSLNTFTSSLDSTYATDVSVTNLSSSLATTIDAIVHTTIPTGTISGSTQLTSSLDSRYVINQAPTATFTDNTDNFNSNLSTSGKTMVSMSISDSESNSPFSASLGGTHGSSFDLIYSNVASSSIGIHAGSDLSAGTYTYDVSVFDTFDKTTTYSSRTITVAQADDGTLGGDKTSYIIESAVNGESIRDTSGYGGGNTSQLSVSYSTSYGTPTVQSYTSSNPAIVIDSSGNLTLGLHISGSTTGSGDTISSTITFTDQYGNSDNDSVTVNVFANHHASASFVEITGDMNTNEANTGVDLLNVTITDTESDTPYSASLSGTDASSFQLQFNNSNSSSVDIQSSGNLLSKEYSYTLNIFDSFGKSNSYSKSLIISESNVGTLSTNGTFYIIESATSGNVIRLSSNGRTGTQGDLGVSYSPNYGSQVVQEFTSSNALIAVNSSGNLTVGTDISGSGEVSGNTINSNITFADQYGNVGSGSISVNVATNNSPDIVFNNSSLINTNQTSGSSGTLVTLSFTDTESDSIDYDNMTFTDSSGQLTATQNSNTWLVTANSQLSASSYTFSSAIEDEHHFSTNTESHTITVVQSGNGTMNGDSSIYIIESAVINDSFRDATGFGNGNTAQIGASYSPSHGSPTIQSFTSTNPAILVDSSGNFTLGVNISGSVTQSGDTIGSDITFTDQYGNIGSGSVTATIFGNQSPSVSFTATSNYETDNATNGSTAGTLSLSDTEGDTPLVVTLSGTHASSFQVSGTNIQANTTLSAGTYTINIIVTDSYSESVTLSNQTITVTQSQDFGKIYIYYSNYGSDAGFAGNYNALMGADTVNSDTPPEVTAYTGNTSSPYYKFKAGDIGTTSISLAGSKNATLAAVVSGSNLNAAISESAAGMSWANGVQSLILFPSGSDMGGIPSSMTDGFGGSTVGQYVVVQYLDGTSAPLGAAGSVLHSIQLDSALHGYSEWFVLGVTGQASASTMRLKVLAVSGSLGAF
jgi:hypothetical protein